MKVTLAMKEGPMAGKERVFDPDLTLSGRIVLGRDPGFDGLILEGDGTVSRRHGEIFVKGRELIFANLGGHGTVIDKVHCLGQRVLEPGTILQLGSHQVEVCFDSPRPSRIVAGQEPQGFWNRGPLARPLVRALLAIYLLGLLFLAWMIRETDPNAAYRRALQSYQTEFLPVLGLSEIETTERLETVDRWAAELTAHTRAQRWQLAEHVCYQLMELDRDPESPVFKFAAQRLGSLAER